VNNALKDRLIMTALVFAALPFVKGPVAWEHVTLETFLNLLWVLLAFGAIVRWVSPDRRRCRHAPGLVSLVFVLSLLFPVISANDDLVQLDLINDAETSQCAAASFKTDKQLPGSAVVTGPPAVPEIKINPLHPISSQFVFEPLPAVSVTIPGGTTGNHSPPHF